MRGWGEGTGGQLGNGKEENSSIPVPVSDISNAIGVDAGDHHSLAVLANGTVWGWGVNFNGQVGDGTTDKRLTPVPVSDISNAVAVSGGDLHSVALPADGTIKTWGRSLDGQLGDGVTYQGGYSKVPVSVRNINTATKIMAGGLSTYALLMDQTVRAWGENTYGQLGNGAPPDDSSIPVAVIGIECN